MLGSTLCYDELIELVTRSGEIQAWIADQLTAAVQEPGDDLLGAVARGVAAGCSGTLRPTSSYIRC